MANANLKIIIPMAGFGTRLRPHTWSKPKPLVSAAGKAVLGHVLDILATAPDADKAELVFIVGYLGDQVERYMQENYAHITAHYLVQDEMRGQSHAIAVAREFLHGPTLVAFVDTIVDTDLAFLADENADAVIWVKEVEDPRRFGVVDVNGEGWVQGLIEKPDDISNNLAIVGYYYFKRGEDLLAAIDDQINNDIRTKGEYFLADAMDLMLKQGLKMRPENVDIWLDAGLPETVLETNRYLLENGRDNSATAAERAGISVVPPVFIHPEAQIENSTIGPHVSISAGCRVENSQIANCVLEADAHVSGAQLQESLVGVRAHVHSVAGTLNVGDDTLVRGV